MPFANVFLFLLLLFVVVVFAKNTDDKWSQRRCSICKQGLLFTVIIQLVCLFDVTVSRPNPQKWGK